MIKVQINLYEHRDKDKDIIEKLGLKETTNPNALIKDILYKFAMNIECKMEVKRETVVEKEIEVKPEKIKTNIALLESMQNLI